jgi:putative colanic acid biosynthesis UDP-glucose lipid carrier transferase
MIDSVSVSAKHLLSSKLTVVPKVIRLRVQVDRKRNYLLVKRGLDILFSLVFILGVLSWLLPLLCILVKLSSKGPVFFTQKRIGRGGKSFTCYKLRTMIVNDHADTQQATENDSRITSLGWFLRKSNIDEFPQFFNILKGDMSLIGPRPHMYADCRKFSAVLPGYKYRNMVKPGLTGLAQVKGYHGPAFSQNSILMRYHWDQYYINHLGWILDTKIIFYTIFHRLFSVLKTALALLQVSKKDKKEIAAN